MSKKFKIKFFCDNTDLIEIKKFKKNSILKVFCVDAKLSVIKIN